MSSTFRRKRQEGSASTPRRHAGTKAWTGGTTLVSTGLRELDAILHGGQPLGTCICLAADRFTTIAETLCRYWCAEGLVHDQSLLIPVQEHPNEKNEGTLPLTEEIHRFLDVLPRSLHVSHQAKQQQEEVPLDTLIEEEEDDDDQGLVVAWQYRSDVQQERLGLTNETERQRKQGNTTFCHSYDLSQYLTTQMDVRSNVTLCPLETTTNVARCVKTLLTQITELHTQRPNHIIRVLIMELPLETLAKALPIILSHIRRKDLPVVFMILNGSTMEEQHSLKWNRIVQRSSDVALEAESFVSRNVYPPPPEFRDFMGILKVYKASTVTLAATAGHFADLTSQKRPAANVYGLKRDSRKLHLSLLHIPPEDYAAEGGSVGKGAERSGAGKPTTQSMGCATTGGGMTVPDF